MSVEIKTPVLPESVSDATVVAWHKQPGDRVSRDENLVDLETDKVVLEVPSPQDGVLLSHAVDIDGIVETGDVLGVVGDEGEEAGDAESGGTESDDSSNSGSSADNDKGSGDGDNSKAENDAEPPTLSNKVSETEDDDTSQSNESKGSASDVLSPAVLRLVDEYHLNPEQIKATGKDGRLTKEDVLNFVNQQDSSEDDKQADTKKADTKQADNKQTDNKQAASVSNKDAAQSKAASEPAKQSSTSKAAASKGSSSQMSSDGRVEERVPMTRLRKTIANRLVDAQQTAAMLTTFNEVNMQPIMDLRARYKDQFEKVHNQRLGFMSFFVQAAVEALKKFPAVNASIDGDDIIYHGYYDVGIAVSTPRGLMVPILRDADTSTIAELETQIREFGSRGKEGKLGMDDLTGGTFSITNGGVFGSMMSTPILNPPQSAILGMHAINDRAVVENGEVVVRPMMYLALTYDHRIIDGREAVQFLVTIKDAIEDPARLLLHL